jgi:hypothetical protein
MSHNLTKDDRTLVLQQRLLSADPVNCANGFDARVPQRASETPELLFSHGPRASAVAVRGRSAGSSTYAVGGYGRTTPPEDGSGLRSDDLRA